MATQLSYLATANKAIKDADTGKVTLVDIFHVVQIPRDLESIPISFVAYGKLIDIPAGHFNGTVLVMDPDDVELAHVDLEGDLAAGDLEIRAQFDLVKIEKTGRHRLHMVANSERLEDNNGFYFEVTKEA